MNNDFNTWYLALLRKQVEEEIQFLVTNGHQAQQINTPCMFCIDTQRGYYKCYRLDELKRFHSSIMSHNSSKLRATPVERKQIGYEAKDIIHEALHQLDINTDSPVFQLK